MTKNELDRLRIAAQNAAPIDPTWLRIAIREIDETRAALDSMCKLYEQTRRRYDETTAELARMRAAGREGF